MSFGAVILDPGCWPRVTEKIASDVVCSLAFQQRSAICIQPTVSNLPQQVHAPNPHQVEESTLAWAAAAGYSSNQLHVPTVGGQPLHPVLTMLRLGAWIAANARPGWRQAEVLEADGSVVIAGRWCGERCIQGIILSADEVARMEGLPAA